MSVTIFNDGEKAIKRKVEHMQLKSMSLEEIKDVFEVKNCIDWIRVNSFKTVSK